MRLDAVHHMLIRIDDSHDVSGEFIPDEDVSEKRETVVRRMSV